MKYNCLIIEDNEIERDLLVSYLKKLDFFNIEAICDHAVDALKELKNKRIDIVFSDIDMPDISGIELLRGIAQPPAFVFVTTFPEYAIDSIDLDALDFIVKPVKIERLIKACNKVIEYLDFKRIQLAEAGPFEDTGNGFFFIKDSKGHIRVNYNDLLYIESFGDFSRIHTLDQQQHLILVNLKNIEQQLPANSFMRVHRQYIINQNLITKIAGNEITLNKQHHLPLGLAYREKLMEYIGQKTLTRRNGT